jgi:hypothetical protein
VNIQPGGPHQQDDGDNGNQDSSPKPEIIDAVEAAVRYLEEPGSIAPDLSPTARRLIESIAAGRADWTSNAIESLNDLPGPPPLDQDSLAVALGLVPADHALLSGPHLKKARQKAGLKPSAISQQLTAAGYQVTAGELQRWENDAAVTISTSLMHALAVVLSVPETGLTGDPTPAVPLGLAMSQQFRDLVRRWAEYTNDTLVAAQTALLQFAAAPARRGTADDDAAVIAALQVFVDSHIEGSST